MDKRRDSREDSNSQGFSCSIEGEDCFFTRRQNGFEQFKRQIGDCRGKLYIFDSELSLLMLSFMEPKVFVLNAPTIFIQQEPGVGFVIEPPIDEIGLRNQPFHRALIKLENSLKQ